MQQIFVIGHTNPDTDTLISAIAMSEFLTLSNKDYEYIPMRTGELNTESQFVFEKFNIPIPELMTDASGKMLYLVDLNETSQIVNGWEINNIVGVIDHHKLNFNGTNPIEITVKPWGCTCTVIYELFRKDNFEIPAYIAPGMLCAILSDTVILRSPTTTSHDERVIEALSQQLGLDYQTLGMEMFTAKAQITDKTPEQIIHSDFKVFEFGEKIVGVGQVEMPDLSLVDDKLPEIIKSMKEIKAENNYHTMLLMLTDIIQEGTRLVVISDEETRVSHIFDVTLENNISTFIPGMLSRKKQVIPQLTEQL